MWLVPFYIDVATYCYYEKVRRTMSNAVVSCLLIMFYEGLKLIHTQSNAILRNFQGVLQIVEIRARYRIFFLMKTVILMCPNKIS